MEQRWFLEISVLIYPAPRSPFRSSWRAARSRCFMPFISIEALKKCTVSCTSGPEITVKERLSEFRREESVNGYHQIGREAVLIFPFRIQIFRYLPPSEDFAMFLDGRMKGWDFKPYHLPCKPEETSGIMLSFKLDENLCSAVVCYPISQVNIKITVVSRFSISYRWKISTDIVYWEKLRRYSCNFSFKLFN